MKKLTTTTTIILFFSAAVFAAEKPIRPDLFDNTDKGINHTRQTTPHSDVLELESFTLNLFDDRTVTAIRDRIEISPQGGKTWIGHIDKEIRPNFIFLSIRGQTMFGSVQIGDENYEIRYAGNGVHAIKQVNLRDIPEFSMPHGHSDGKIMDTGSGALVSTSTSTSTGSTPLASGATTGTIVDLLVAYTPKARINNVGASGLEAKIINAVAMANQAYLNSQIDMQLKLVKMVEIPYAENGDMTVSLYDFYWPGDGKMDEIHNLRNTYGADQVMLITADTNYCGYAYVMSAPGASWAQYAFSAMHDGSKYACFSNNTLAHELGHNQGNVHDPDNAGFAGAYPYSYGFRQCVTGGIRTIMSYSCSGASLIPHFANPSVSYNGEATGVVDKNDTARSMTNTKAIVAAFRPSVDTTPPVTPGNLLASTVSDSQLALAWQDLSSNEAGFRLERSVDGVTWKEILTTAANAISFTDGGLLPETTYQYRVRAYNGFGTSAYSNIASAKTAGCVTSAPLLSVSPAQQVSKGQISPINATITNKDASSCPGTAFSVTDNAGVTLGTSLLAPGQSASLPWSISLPSSDGTITRTATATATGHGNAAGNASITIDTVAPSTPSGLTATLSKTTVKVSWTASQDSTSGVSGYTVMRNGVAIGTVTTTSFSQAPGKGTFTYSVVATDKAGNISAPSNSATVTLTR